MAQTVALLSERVESAADLAPAFNRAFAPFRTGRPGPTHIEIPLDIAGEVCPENPVVRAPATDTSADPMLIEAAVQRLATAKAPVILVGGGARRAGAQVQALAERLDAPVVQTVNARGLMYDHPLGVPASPSLQAVRALIKNADVVLALGTELGQTDYDMYATDTMAAMPNLIRVDLCPEQLDRHEATLKITADASAAVSALLDGLGGDTASADGAARAATARQEAFEEIGPEMRALCDVLNTMRDTMPGSIMVGDSVYPIYAGNLYYDHDRPGGWFNAATGFGALGYGIPAAIGAALADPTAPVICIAGDGGAQFSLPELMCAVDENLAITFVIWNNYGYQEIATSMQAVGVTVLGCDPTPPDFEYVARSCGMPFWRTGPEPSDVAEALTQAHSHDGPRLIEIRAPNQAHSS